MSSPSPFFPPCLWATEQRFTESQSSSGALSSPHVSPQVCVRRKGDFCPPHPPKKTTTNQQTDAGAAVFPSPSLLFSFLSPFFPPVCSCSLCVTERKLSSLPPSSYSLGVVIPLLLSSALLLNAEPGSHAACKYTQCAAVLPYISLRGGVWVCVRRGRERGWGGLMGQTAMFMLYIPPKQWIKSFVCSSRSYGAQFIHIFNKEFLRSLCGFIAVTWQNDKRVGLSSSPTLKDFIPNSLHNQHTKGQGLHTNPAVSHAACSSGIFIAWMTPSGQRLPWEANTSKRQFKCSKLQYKQELLWKSSFWLRLYINWLPLNLQSYVLPYPLHSGY